MKDPYDILGVSREADDAEIKKVYRKLAVQYHPDKNKGDPAAEEKFKEISAAYDQISTAEKRAQRDRVSQGFGGFGGFDMGFGMEDFLNINFGGFGFNKNSSRGADLTTTIRLDFIESVKGCSKKVQFYRLDKCDSCNGLGGEDVKLCASCGGKGKKAHQSGFGMTTTTICGTCGGRGKWIGKKCDSCGGKGGKQKKETITMKIPPGIENGMAMRVKGKGNWGEAATGNLMVVINVEEHPKFKRNGNNIITIEDISYIDAIIGGTKKVETIWGPAEIKISQGTQNNKKYYIEGKGINGRAHIVVCNLVVPESPSQKEIEYLKKLKELDEQ